MTNNQPTKKDIQAMRKYRDIIAKSEYSTSDIIILLRVNQST